MTVQTVMTANPACCAPSTRLVDVAALMHDYDCGQIPVIADDGSGKPIGVVTDRDIAIRMVARGRNPLQAQASDCMTSPCITVTEDTSLASCCEVMETNKIRRVPVVDGEGRICGIVALADVVRCASQKETAEVIKEVSVAC